MTRDEMIRLRDESAMGTASHALWNEAIKRLDAAGLSAKNPPYPFCNHPEKCIPSGRCERTVGGERWCCAD